MNFLISHFNEDEKDKINKDFQLLIDNKLIEIIESKIIYNI